MKAYVDSSVLMRLVLGEAGKLAQWGSFRSASTSALAEVECLRTLDRLSLRGALSLDDLADRRAAVYGLLEDIEVLGMDRAVLARAAQPFPTPLTTLDAIHLATAILSRELDGPNVFATHDVALAKAARSVGFGVVGA